MNIESAKKICSEFRPIETEDGKTKCRFYESNGICKRPEFFRCELVLYREQEERKLIRLPQLSISRVDTAMRCPRLYAFNYVYKTTPPVPAKWKITGRAFGDAAAKIDLGIGYELNGEINSMQVDKAKVNAVLRRYKEWKRDWGRLFSEYKVFFQYKDVYFIGYADRVTADKTTIIEWKYAATQYDELKAIKQASVYLKGIPEAERFILAVAKKPLQKLKSAGKPMKKEPNPKAETPADLEERIYNELESKKDEQFTYTVYDRGFFDIDATIDQLYRSHKLVAAYEAAGWPPALGMTCENCDYRPYCLKHLTEIGCDRKLCSHPTICNQIRKTKALPIPERLLTKGDAEKCTTHSTNEPETERSDDGDIQ